MILTARLRFTIHAAIRTELAFVRLGPTSTPSPKLVFQATRVDNIQVDSILVVDILDSILVKEDTIHQEIFLSILETPFHQVNSTGAPTTPTVSAIWSTHDALLVRAFARRVTHPLPVGVSKRAVRTSMTVIRG